MSRSRRPPLQHPLAHPFGRAVDSLTAALTSESGRQYRGTARHFLTFLRAHYPEVGSLDQLRRDPHILGWLTHLRSQTPPLAVVSYINRLMFLRCILEELAGIAQRFPDWPICSTARTFPALLNGYPAR